jgi:hypothetical protein
MTQGRALAVVALAVVVVIILIGMSFIVVLGILRLIVGALCILGLLAVIRSLTRPSR